MTKLTKLLLAITALCLTATTYINAQSPNAIPYQGVARNASGEILPTQAIGLRISLRDVTAGGTIVYQETHTPTTTALGLFNINIGTGTPSLGTLAAVNWGNGAKFMQVELDPAGGTSYTDMGTTQLMSVPYALFAGKSADLPEGTATGNTMRWNGTAWVSDNALFNDGTNVGMGTTLPQSKLHVASSLFPPAQLQLNDNVTTFFANPTAIITNGSQTTGNWSFIGFADSASANPFLSAKIGAKYTDRTNNYASLGFGTRSSSGMAERMTISSVGNVGIGTTAPNAPLQFANATANRKIVFWENANDDNQFYGFGLNGLSLRYQTASTNADHVFYAGSSATTSNELMRIKGTGSVYIGPATGPARLIVRQDLATTYVASFQNLINGTGNNYGLVVFAGQSSFTTNQNLIAFFSPASSALGGVLQNSGSSVTYATTSDIRLKSNITPTRYGLNELKQIEVKDYFYKNDDKTPQNGFIAQQLYKIYPFAVVPGGDDAKESPWMVDYGKITPLLVKSIQEQQEQMDDFKAQIEAQQKLIDELTKRLQALENK